MRTPLLTAVIAAPALLIAAPAQAGVMLGIDLNNFGIQGPANIDPAADAGVLDLSRQADTVVASIEIDELPQTISDTDGNNDGEPPLDFDGQFVFDSGAITGGFLSLTDEDGDVLNITDLAGNINDNGIFTQNITINALSFDGVFAMDGNSDGRFFGVTIDDWLNSQPLQSVVFTFAYDSALDGFDSHVDAEIALVVGDQNTPLVPAPGTLPAGLAVLGFIGVYTRRTAAPRRA